MQKGYLVPTCAHLEGAALGHQHAPRLAVLAEVDGLQLLLELRHLRVALLQQPLQAAELAVDRGVQQQLPHLLGGGGGSRFKA
jgi:hypothetical protein